MSMLFNIDASWSSIVSPLPPLSTRILGHDGLITPILERHFGEIEAVELDAAESRDHYVRTSTLYQRGSTQWLLDATLMIVKRQVPESLLEQLRSTSIPFEQLLMDHGVDVELEGRLSIELRDDAGQVVARGRQHEIVHRQTGERVCQVREMLAPEAELSAAQVRPRPQRPELARCG